MTAKIVALSQNDTGDVRLLEDPYCRAYGLTTVAATNTFRRIFEGPFCAFFGFQRQRTKEDIAMLLLKHGCIRSAQEAEDFLKKILGKELYLTEDRTRQVTLQKEPGQDRFYLEYTDLSDITKVAGRYR